MDDDIDAWLRDRPNIGVLEDADDEGPRPPIPPQEKQFSESGKLYLQLWAMGLISLQAVQTIAHANFKDGLRPRDVVQMASLDNWGSGVGHGLREFRNRFIFDSNQKFKMVNSKC